MDLALIIAVIGASVSAIGWLVNYVFTTAEQRRREKVNFQLDFTKQQLQELYGPLVFLVLEGRRTFKELLTLLGRKYVFLADEPLSDSDLKIWLFWVDYDSFPRNDKVRELISTKSYLVEGAKVPDSWLAFLDHMSSWKVNHERWKREGIAYSWHSRVNWPNDFESDIISTFEMLKKRQATLIGMRVK